MVGIFDAVHWSQTTRVVEYTEYDRIFQNLY